jgi:hypothetical protein
MTQDEKDEVRKISAELAADLVEWLDKEEFPHPAIPILTQFRKLIGLLAPILAEKKEEEFHDTVTELLREIVVEQEYGPNWRVRLEEDPCLFVDFEAIDELLNGLKSLDLINQTQKDDLSIGISAIAERDGSVDIDRLKRSVRLILKNNLGFSPETIVSAYDAFLTDDEIKAIAEESIREVLDRRGSGLN